MISTKLFLEFCLVSDWLCQATNLVAYCSLQARAYLCNQDTSRLYSLHRNKYSFLTWQFYPITTDKMRPTELTSILKLIMAAVKAITDP